MKDAEQQADERWRDVKVGEAEAELPEPWFIRDLREQRLAAGADRREPVREPDDELRLDRSRDVAGPASATADFHDGPSDFGAANAAMARRQPVWLYAGVAGMIAILALALWWTAAPRVGGADSIAVAPAPTPPVATATVAAAAPATGLCVDPATLDRLRGLLIQDAARAGGDPAGLVRAAAGLSLSVAETPDASGDAGAATCRGWLSLIQAGSAPVSTPVSFRALPASGGGTRISILLGTAPAVAALVDASAGNASLADAGGTVGPADYRPETPQAAIVAPVAASAPPVVPADVPARRAPVAAAAPAPRYSNPSFDCRRVTSWANRTICASDALAEQDRAMATLFYDIAADAGPSLRADLEDSRTDFLSRIQRCDDEDCIASVYDDRIEELRSYR